MNERAGPGILRTFVINGYGVPPDILTDGNYYRYLSQCADIIFGGITDAPIIILCGGPTHPKYPHKTEAGEMRRWFEEHYPEKMARANVRLINETIDLRGNFDGVARELTSIHANGVLLHFAYFVEYCRQDFPTYLAAHMFPNATVIPIIFDARGRLILDRLKHLLRLPLRIIATHSKLVRNLIERPLRRRHIDSQR